MTHRIFKTSLYGILAFLAHSNLTRKSIFIRRFSYDTSLLINWHSGIHLGPPRTWLAAMLPATHARTHARTHTHTVTQYHCTCWHLRPFNELCHHLDHHHPHSIESSAFWYVQFCPNRAVIQFNSSEAQPGNLAWGKRVRGLFRLSQKPTVEKWTVLEGHDGL